MSRSVRSERGAMVIMVAIALLGLTVFSAFVLDYGILWTARAQAQNSADAGALAAAINMMDDPGNLVEARAVARAAANRNFVWSEAPASGDVLVDLPITCPPPIGAGAVGCVRVDVQRGQVDRNGGTHTNVLPTFFARLLGINQQAIMATATAQVTAGNAVQCIKPWIVADKWHDTTADTDDPLAVPSYNGDSWDRDDTFLPGTDTYNPANGFNPTFDQGYEMPLKPGNIGTWSAGWAMEIDFGCLGSNCYNQNIEGCPEWVPQVNIWNPTEYASHYGPDNCDDGGDATDPAFGCLSVKTGMSVGPTAAGVHSLIDLDLGATWVDGDDPGTVEVEKGYVNSPCMTANNCRANFGDPATYTTVGNTPVDVSARIVPIAIFDTTSFANQGCSGTGCVARVTNLGGFFIEGMCDEVFATTPSWCGTTAEAKKTVIGRFMKYPGQFTGTGGTTTNTFAKAVTLVR